MSFSPPTNVKLDGHMAAESLEGLLAAGILRKTLPIRRVALWQLAERVKFRVVNQLFEVANHAFVHAKEDGYHKPKRSKQGALAEMRLVSALEAAVPGSRMLGTTVAVNREKHVDFYWMLPPSMLEGERATPLPHGWTFADPAADLFQRGRREDPMPQQYALVVGIECKSMKVISSNYDMLRSQGFRTAPMQSEWLWTELAGKGGRGWLFGDADVLSTEAPHPTDPSRRVLLLLDMGKLRKWVTTIVPARRGERIVTSPLQAHYQRYARDPVGSPKELLTLVELQRAADEACCGAAAPVLTDAEVCTMFDELVDMKEKQAHASAPTSTSTSSSTTAIKRRRVDET